MRRNLDIWAIQYYANELANALNNIHDGISIIFSNLKSNLKIGNQKIKSRQFDTVLYNEQSNVLVMLTRNGLVTKDDMIKYLEKTNKRYVEITFNYDIYDYKEGDNVPELWFAREKYVLEDAIKDSIDKNMMVCEYYPTIRSNLELGYFSKYSKYINLDGRHFEGLLKFSDKLILLVNQRNNINEFGESRNIKPKEVIELLEKNNLNYKVIIDKEPQIFEDDFSKKLRKIK